MSDLSTLLKKWFPLLGVAGIVLLAGVLWQGTRTPGDAEGFISGNGRIEATEINIATKIAGRVQTVSVREGDFVTQGQMLAQMQVDTLLAQLEEARASQQRAVQAVAVAKAQVALAQSNVEASRAAIRQRDAELHAARQRLARSETLSSEGAASQQELDDDRARVASAQAALAAARAQTQAMQASVVSADSQVLGAEATVTAANATIARISADIKDAQLIAPRDGRIQFQVAQAGEVIGNGGTVFNMVDLSDVYMTFFLPEQAAGRVGFGTEVRIILDAAPQYVIPATVSFVASSAQFTPKTVETQSERQKLMFRVRAKISEDLLLEHLEQVKTGLPGMAWIRLDPARDWPEDMQVNLGD